MDLQSEIEELRAAIRRMERRGDCHSGVTEGLRRELEGLRRQRGSDVSSSRQNPKAAGIEP